MIPYASIAIMAFNILLSVALPTALALILRKRFNLSLRPFFVGCLVWLVFVLILEKILHLAVLGSPAGDLIRSSTWYYALYGGLAAGLFEEGGRFIAMKTILRKEQNNDNNAILYGAGHGGIEALMVLGVGMVNNLIYSVLYNTGNLGLITAPLDDTQKAAFQTVIDQLTSTSPATFLISPVERIIAIILHIALSVIVWTGITRKRPLLFPLAIFLHFIVDAVSVILSRQGMGAVLVELIILVIVLTVAWYAYRLFRQRRTDSSVE